MSGVSGTETTSFKAFLGAVFFFHFVFFYIHNSQLDISIMALHNSGQLVLSVPEDIPPWTGMCHNAEGWVNEKHTICISKPYSLDLFLGSFLAIT